MFRRTAALGKPMLSLCIALSAVLGYGLARSALDRDAVILGALVWALSMGAAALNNVQDRDYDRQFARTRNRVLVRGEVSVALALGGGVILIGTSLILLYKIFGPLGPWLPGLGGILCYNALYTPLKKKTLVALIPGVACGMLPPVMGWTAAAGQGIWADPLGLYLLMLVMGVWQVAHFFVIQVRTPMPDLARAYPVLTRNLSPAGLSHQVFLWTSLYSLALFLFVIYNAVAYSGCALAVGVNAALVPLMVGGLLWQRLAQRPAVDPVLCHGVITLSLVGFMVTGLYDCFIRWA